MGNNEKDFRGSRKQCKRFRDQMNLSLKHVRQQVVLLMENKGQNKKKD